MTCADCSVCCDAKDHGRTEPCEDFAASPPPAAGTGTPPCTRNFGCVLDAKHLGSCQYDRIKCSACTAALARAEQAEAERDEIAAAVEATIADLHAKALAGKVAEVCGHCGAFAPLTVDDLKAHIATCEKNPAVQRALAAEAERDEAIGANLVNRNAVRLQREALAAAIEKRDAAEAEVRRLRVGARGLADKWHADSSERRRRAGATEDDKERGILYCEAAATWECIRDLRALMAGALLGEDGETR